MGIDPTRAERARQIEAARQRVERAGQLSKDYKQMVTEGVSRIAEAERLIARDDALRAELARLLVGVRQRFR